MIPNNQQSYDGDTTDDNDGDVGSSLSAVSLVEGSTASTLQSSGPSRRTNRSSKLKQLQHDRIASSTRGLRNSAGFATIVGLLGFSFLMSIGIGVILLSKHEHMIGGNNIVLPNELLHDNTSINENNDNSKGEGAADDGHNDIMETMKQQAEDQRKELRRRQQQKDSGVDQVIVPYDEPFMEIPNGHQLAAKLSSGIEPSVAGIVHVLQMFLRKLRESNIELGNVSNDREGEDQIRNAYFRIAKDHLIPQLDEPYRGRTIFPVRVDEDSIFISLAAYREHLLYDTLAGAFGQAKFPEKINVGIVLQNCFGRDDQTGEPYKCFTGVQVVGNDAQGRPLTKVSETTPDVNGVQLFCTDPKFVQYCEAGQIRVLSVHESEALGPAIARYYASKLWGGETFFLQVDAHLQFTELWDEHYINEAKATINYPKSVLSMYPPGFGHVSGTTPGTRLCTCEFSQSDVEDHIIRINNGVPYKADVEYKRPTQIAFIAAGFFFARAEFLRDVPFDPFLPWCFMGEEIALSMRAWTAGWNIYAPRKNWIAHQYRPGRLGLPKFWETVGRVFHRGIGISNRLQAQVVHRIKYIVGYPDAYDQIQQHDLADVLEDVSYYGMGTERSRDAYISFTNIDFDQKRCHYMQWCNKGELE